MNIKSLLLGSAAALVAVSGARAADAVMAEPEAVEYVRVCDAYGAGFFYIPGTETCLKISGRVRYQIDYDSTSFSYQDLNGNNSYDVGEPTSNGWRKNASAMLNVTAKSDTELGTLTSYIELSAGRNSGTGLAINVVESPVGSGNFIETINGYWGLDHAWISLGGLKMGFSDTLYDGGLDGEGAKGGGGGIHFMSYTFTSGSVSATLALEEDTYDVNYVPNVVGKVSWTMAPVGVDVWVAYDDDDTLVGASDAGWSAKARLSADVGTSGKLKVLGSYNSNNNFYANGGTWTIGASYAHTFSPKLTLTGLVQYQGDTNFGAAGAPNNIVFGGVVDYTIVPDFSAKLAVWHNTNGAAPGSTNAFLRFQRSF